MAQEEHLHMLGFISTTCAGGRTLYDEQRKHPSHAYVGTYARPLCDDEIIYASNAMWRLPLSLQREESGCERWEWSASKG